MKKLFYACAAFVMFACSLASCAQREATKGDKTMERTKILVAFFSRAGENYGVGNIKVGNTQIVAEMIARELNADTFCIEPLKAYSTTYDACVELAKAERDAAARPAIKGDKNIEDYDIVFLGYPNWWGDAPMPVYTFIEKHNWKGKTVIPFCTHEGSGLSNLAQIKAACVGATVLNGFGMYGHVAQKQSSEAETKVKSLLKSLENELRK